MGSRLLCKPGALALLLVAASARADPGPGAGAGADVASTPAPPSANDLVRLEQGEVLLDFSTKGDPPQWLTLRALMHTDAARVWNVIASCDQAYIYLAGLEFCELLEDRRDYARTHHIVNRGWSSPRVDYIFETHREPYEFKSFRLIEGNLRDLQGSWRFEDVPEGLLVTHRISMQPAFPVPRWLMRRMMQRDMADMVACIRGLASGSGGQEAEAADQDRCPGNAPRRGAAHREPLE